MVESQWINCCCNPFELPNHASQRKGLRPVSEWMCEKAPKISMRDRICDSCRKKLAKVSLSPSCEVDTDVYKADPLTSVNQCLGELGETPICKWKLRQAQYPKEKLDKLTTVMRKAMKGDDDSEDSDVYSEGEIVKQLKDAFHSSPTQSRKVQILTVLPQSWSVLKIQREFCASNYMV